MQQLVVAEQQLFQATCQRMYLERTCRLYNSTIIRSMIKTYRYYLANNKTPFDNIMSALALVVLLAVVSLPLADSTAIISWEYQEIWKLRDQIEDLRNGLAKSCPNVMANENLSKANYPELRLIFSNTRLKLSMCMRCKNSKSGLFAFISLSEYTHIN